MLIGTNYDFDQNQIIRPVVHNLTSDPSGVEGQIYCNTTAHVIKAFLNSTWVTFSTGGNVSGSTNQAAYFSGTNAVGGISVSSGLLGFNSTGVPSAVTSTTVGAALVAQATNAPIFGTVILTQPASNATLTLASGTTLTTSANFTTTGSGNLTLGNSSTNSVVTMPGTATANLLYNTSNPAQYGLPYAGGASGLISYATAPSSANATWGLTSVVTALAAVAPSWVQGTGSGAPVFASSPSLTTPSLGVATATSINGLTITSSTGTLTVANGSTLATSGAFAITLTASAATNITLPTSGTLMTNPMTALGDQIYGGASGVPTKLTIGTPGVSQTYIITTTTNSSSIIQAPTFVLATGTGAPVLATSPTLVTPTLGVATATSINSLTITTSAGTLTINNNAASSLVTTGAYAITLAATAASTVTMPASTSAVMNYYTSAPTQYNVPYAGGASGLLTYATAPTTTGTYAFVSTPAGTAVAPSWVSGTGTGSPVFSTSPSLTTPSLGAATATSINSLTISTSVGTLTIANNASAVITHSGNYAQTFTATAASSVTMPASTTAVMQYYNSGAAPSQYAVGYTNTASSGLLTYLTPPTVTGNYVLMSNPAGSAVAPIWSSAGTGTGTVPVFQTSPSLITPSLGVATATSINSLTISTSAGTLTVANNASAVISFSGNYAQTFTATAASSVAMPASVSATMCYYTSAPAAQYNLAYANATSGLIAYLANTAYGTLVASSAGAPQWTTPAAGVLFAANATTVPSYTTAITGCTYNGLTVTSTVGTLTIANTAGASLVTSGGGYAINLAANGAASTVTMPASTSAVMNYYTSAPSQYGLPYAGAASGLISYLAVPGSLSVLTGNTGGAPSWTVATGTGAPVLGTNPTISITSAGNLSLNYTPANATDAVMKSYVDNLVQGLDQKPTANYATTTYLNATQNYTYNNGTAGVGATLTNNGTQAALTVDGRVATVGDVVLVKNEVTYPQYNGLYVVTTVGSGSTNWVLTRHTSFDQAAEVTNAFIPVGNSANIMASGTQTVTINTTPKTIVLSGSGTLNWTTLGAVAGTAIEIAGFTGANVGLNGVYNVVSITTTTATNDTITFSTTFPDGLGTGSPSQVGGVSVFLTGVVNSNTLWLCETVSAVIGTTPMTFTQLNSATNLTAGTNISISGNTIGTVASPTFTNITMTLINNLGITAGSSSTLTLGANSSLNIAATTGLAITGGSSYVLTLNAQATATIQMPAASGTLLYYTSGNAPTAANQIPFTVGASGSTQYTAVNSTATNYFLRQVSSGAPAFAALASGDITTALTYTPTKKFTQTFTGSGPSFGPYTHGLGSANIVISVYDNSGNLIMCDAVVTSTQITLTFGYGVPGGNTFTLVCVG
jgi:hypothetical protein